MSKVRYAKSGKQSRSWWLNMVRQYGMNSLAAICRAGNVQGVQARTAVGDLEEEGMVTHTGEIGRGHTPPYYLTALGERYLERNPDELGISLKDLPANTAHDHVYTYTTGNGHITYFLDGKVIAAMLVPDAELARIRSEITGLPIEPDKTEQPAPPVKGYTWKMPVVGPARYFLNGEFILETKVPHDEMNRMLKEQGSPLLGTQETHSYRVKVLDNGRRLYFKGKTLITESEIPAEHQQWMKTWMPPKEGDPRLKATRRPKNPDDMLDDDLGDEPGRDMDVPHKSKVSNSTPLPALPFSSNRVRTDDDMPPMPADFLEPEPAKANEPSHKETATVEQSTPVISKNQADKALLDSDKETELAAYPYCGTCQAPTRSSCISEHVRYDSRQRYENYQLPKRIPENAMPAAQELLEQPKPAQIQISDNKGSTTPPPTTLAAQLRAAVSDMLLMRYGDDVTVKDLLEFVESRDD